MSTATIAEVQANFDYYLAKSKTEGPVVIVSDGKPVGILLTPHDQEDFDQLVAGRSPRFRSMLEKSRQSIADGKGLSGEDFWRTVHERAEAKQSKSCD